MDYKEDKMLQRENGQEKLVIIDPIVAEVQAAIMAVDLSNLEESDFPSREIILGEETIGGLSELARKAYVFALRHSQGIDRIEGNHVRAQIRSYLQTRMSIVAAFADDEGETVSNDEYRRMRIVAEQAWNTFIHIVWADHECWGRDVSVRKDWILVGQVEDQEGEQAFSNPLALPEVRFIRFGGSENDGDDERFFTGDPQDQGEEASDLTAPEDSEDPLTSPRRCRVRKS